MPQRFLRTTALLFASSLLAYGAIACSSEEAEEADVSASEPVQAAVSQPAPPKPKTKPPAPKRNSYNEAIRNASSAINYSKTAAVREDWTIVVSYWNRAIKNLQATPKDHPQYSEAQKKLPQYQRFLAEAQQKAQPPQPTKVNEKGDINPKYFAIPIKRREGGLLVIDVKVNNQQTFEMYFDTGAQITLLSGVVDSTLDLPQVDSMGIRGVGGAIFIPVVKVQTLETNGRIKKNMQLPVHYDMNIGLLGQDFFEGYDYTIKQNAIEFRLR